jgi:DNA-binding NtrC family response regulator
MTALVNYPWPGNIRELKNWIEQALVLADGDPIDLQHFPALARESEPPRTSAPLAPLGLRLEELERWYVLETLRRADGNRTKAARLLGISLRGLQYKLRRYGTDRAVLEPEAGGPYAPNGGGFEPQAGGRGALGPIAPWNERPSASLNG